MKRVLRPAGWAPPRGWANGAAMAARAEDGAKLGIATAAVPPG